MALLFFFGSRPPRRTFPLYAPLRAPFLRFFAHSFARSCYLSPSLPSIHPFHFPPKFTHSYISGRRFSSVAVGSRRGLPLFVFLRAPLPSPIRSLLRSFVLSFPLVSLHTSMSFSQNSPILTFSTALSQNILSLSPHICNFFRFMILRARSQTPSGPPNHEKRKNATPETPLPRPGYFRAWGVR